MPAIPVRASLALFALLALYVAMVINPIHVAVKISGQPIDHPLTLQILFWLRSTAVVLGLAALAGAVSNRVFRFYAGEWFIFVLPLVGVLYFAALKADLGLLNQLYLFLVFEDGPFEALSFVCFLASSLVGIAIVVRAFSSGLHLVGWFHLGLSAFLMFVALEEISYGQRIFQFTTPNELQKINRQKELNLHNIKAIERFTLLIGPLLVSLYGVFGWVARLLMKWVLPHWLVTGSRLCLVATPWYLASYFLPLAAFTLIALFAKKEVGFWVDRDQELAEFFLSLGFILFIVTVWFDLKTAREGAHAMCVEIGTSHSGAVSSTKPSAPPKTLTTVAQRRP